MRALREERGLRQDDVAQAARRLGFRWSRAAVAKLEAGQRHLSVAEFLSLADLLTLAAKATRPSSLFGRGTAAVALADLVPDDGWIGLTRDNRTRAGALRLLLRGHVGEGKPRDRELPAHRDVAVDRERTVPGRRHPRAERDAIRRAVWPDAPDTEVREAEREAAGEAEQKAAGRLRVPAFAIALAARRRWQRSLTAERDRRVFLQAVAAAEEEAEGTQQPRTVQAVRGHLTRALLRELHQAFGAQFRALGVSRASRTPGRSASRPRRPPRHAKRLVKHP